MAALCYRRRVPTASPAPLLLALLATAGCERPAPAPDAPAPAFRVWIFTSASPEGPWERAATPLQSGWSSLGLHEEEDGALALVGLKMERPTPEEERAPRLRVRGWRAASGLTRARANDPASWAAAEWPLEDPGVVAAIDPQRFEGAFWYYAAEGRGGDPALAAGPHALRSSPPPTARLSGAGLADPSPARFRGEILLFATAYPDAVVLAAGDPLVERARFPGVSVPFARALPAAEGGERLWLLAQAAVEGRRQPVLSLSEDGQTWSPWAKILDLGSLGSCTSPVLGPLADGWLLACVEEPGR